MKKQIAQRLCITALGLGLAFFGMPGQAKATTIGTCDVDPLLPSPQPPGFCGATVDLSGVTLTMTLTNTSPTGGYITALAFDLAGAGPSAFSAPPLFNVFAGPIGVSPFGTRDVIFSISTTSANAWDGATPLGVGITAPSTGTFVVSFSSLGLLTEASVASSMAIRFKDFTPSVPGGDKDLLSGITRVPEPSSLLFLGAGLLGLGVWSIRKSTTDKV